MRTVESGGVIAEFNNLPEKEREEKLKKARANSFANRADAWTYEEEETLRSMSRQGYDIERIAVALPDRTAKAVEAKFIRMRRSGDL